MNYRSIIINNTRKEMNLLPQLKNRGKGKKKRGIRKRRLRIVTPLHR